MRICSFFPSATETVFALEMGDSLVGVSHECNYPPEALNLPKVTKTNIPAGLTSAEIDRIVSSKLQSSEPLYDLDTELLESLAPDLIITQRLCDVCAVSLDQIQEAVDRLNCRSRVLSLQSNSLQGILADISAVAAAVGDPEKGDEVVSRLKERIDRVARKTRTLRMRPRVFCMEWVDPPYCGGHWMKELVEIAGGEDALSVLHRPSYRIPWKSVIDFAPDIIVLTCCGYDLERCAREAELLVRFEGAREIPALQNGQVFATDSSAYFARPGPRIVDSLEILAHILHPTMFAAPPLPKSFLRLDPARSLLVSSWKTGSVRASRYQRSCYADIRFAVCHQGRTHMERLQSDKIPANRGKHRFASISRWLTHGKERTISFRDMI